MRTMKILITGATGLVGRSLLPLLKDHGHEVIALSRNPETAGVRLPIACQILQWNPLSPNIPTGLPNQIDAVIHLCGEGLQGRWTEKRKQAIYDSRVISTCNLRHVCLQSKLTPKVWISASAIGYYKSSRDSSLDETDPPGDGFLSNVCKDWESETFKAEALGVRTLAFRLGIILGSDGGALEKMLPPFRMGLGGPLGNGDQWMSWIHVRDAVGLIVAALENPAYRGPINAVSKYPVTNKEFTNVLAQTLKRPAIFTIPAFALKLLFGEMSQLLLTSQKVLSQKAVDSGYRFIYPKLNNALKVICDQVGHKMITEQWVSQPIDRVFDFFSNPMNLEILTPDFLHFQVLQCSHTKVQEGTVIDYQLKLHGITFKWRSQISDWVSGKRFSDQQVKGPYAFWHHTHEFYESKGGTLIRDHVVYKLPGGVPGDSLAHAYVKRDLEKIFIFRREQIESLLSRNSKSTLE